MQHDIPPALGEQFWLKVIRAENVVWKPNMRSARLVVQASLGNVSRKTKVLKKSLSPKWDEAVPLLNATAKSTIVLSLIHQSRIKKSRDVSIGTVELAMSDLLGKTGEVPVQLESSDNQQTALLYLQLVVKSATDNVIELIRSAEQNGARITHPSGHAATDAIDSTLAAVQQSGDLYFAVQTLFGKLDSIKPILDDLATIHPFVSAAWTMASALYRVIDKQFKTDQAVVELAEKLSDCLDFALDAEQVRKKLEGVHSTVAKLFDQITECCLFIREYTGKGFVGRALCLEDQQSKIDAFVESLDTLRRYIDQGITLHAAIVTAHMAGRVNRLELKALLEPDSIGPQERRSCQEGTRVSVLRDITDWILTESSQNVLWLHGAAGSGKTTIARSIQDYVLRLERQGAYLRFERGKSSPDSVIRTVAFQLALYDSRIAESIITALENLRLDTKATPIPRQFEDLLIGPLTACSGSISGPVVIILDALDECGDAGTRVPLLRALEKITRLPSTYRFLITGREEADLHTTFGSPAWSTSIHPINVGGCPDETQRDIRKFLDSELRESSGRYKDPQRLAKWEQNIGKLTEMSLGMFIYAATAAKLTRGVDSFAMLQELVSGKARLESLDELYTTVLERCGLDWKTGTRIKRFKDIIGFMLLRKAPLVVSTIDDILGLSEEQSSCAVLEALRPLVSQEPGKPVYFWHTTIFDYFLDPKHKHFPWFIDASPHHYSLTHQCFAMMKKSLRFNIAGLDSSCAPNKAVSGLELKLSTIIPPGLCYASFYWAGHLCDCNAKDPAAGKLLEDVREFLLERLLFWVEVLSLLDFKGRDKIFIAVSQWLQNSSFTSETLVFLKDARKLLNIFDVPIGQSTPHIYVSMLPLMQPEYITAAHYHPQIPASGIAITHHGTRTQSPRLKTLNTEYVDCATFSPVHQTQLACGYYDGGIEVWDIESGEVTSRASTRHNNHVSAMAFTHDGKKLVSGSGDGSIKVWDMNGDSEEILCSNGQRVHCLAISLDNASVAFGSACSGIQVWGLNEKTAVVQPFRTQDTFTSVAFCPGPNNQWLASATVQGSLHTWNFTDGQTKEFNCIDGKSYSKVIFTPDGEQLLCGSDNGQIYIYEAATLSVLQTLSGHTSSIHSLHISPTTGYLLSSSGDQTMRVWDIKRGVVLVEPVMENVTIWDAIWSCDGQHISCIASGQACIYDALALPANSCRELITNPAATNFPLRVATISSSNTLIVAGGYDGSVTMWQMDIDGTWKVLQLDGRHTVLILSVTISPDEAKVVTTSYDTVLLWSINSEPSTKTNPRNIDTHHLGGFAKFSPISPDLAVVTGESVQIYHSGTGNLTATLRPAMERIVSAAYSPDGSKLAVACEDGKIRVLDCMTGLAVQTLRGCLDPMIYQVTLSSDYSRVATGIGNQLRVWDTYMGDVLFDLPNAHCTSHISSVAFSADCTRLLSTSLDTTIKVWDTTNGMNLLKVHRGHMQDVGSAQFSSDGSLIVSSSIDGTVRIWDAAEIMSPVPTLKEDGWLVDEQGRLLLWIPPDLRVSLLRDAAEIDVLRTSFSTRVDISNFKEDGWRSGTWASGVGKV
ncbi:WD40-repeat-containing domain protein [Cytidiella melzeri]|nr:WD40-repeat-containing domain protein [Cytidiella melzeri]